MTWESIEHDNKTTDQVYCGEIQVRLDAYDQRDQEGSLMRRRRGKEID